MGPGHDAGPADRDLLLTGEVGRRVTTSGDRPGRVADLTVRLGPDRPPVLRALVRAGDATALVPLGLVGQDRPLDLSAWTVDPHRLPLAHDELLLARDVLDTQVVDLKGRRLSRVSDVLLRRDAGGGLEVVGVDLGTAGLLRRLGLGLLGAGSGVLALDWRHLHLTSPRGHLVQLDTDAAPFRTLDPRGLAELLARLSTPRAIDVVRAVEPAHAEAALRHSHPRTRRRLVGSLTGVERPARRRFRRTEGWRLHRPPGGGP